MRKRARPKLTASSPGAQLLHLKGWLEAIGSRIIVRWKSGNDRLFVFELDGKSSCSGNFRESKAFLAGVVFARRETLHRLDEDPRCCPICGSDRGEHFHDLDPVIHPESL